jgi:sortase A
MQSRSSDWVNKARGLAQRWGERPATVFVCLVMSLALLHAIRQANGRTAGEANLTPGATSTMAQMAGLPEGTQTTEPALTLTPQPTASPTLVASPQPTPTAAAASTPRPVAYSPPSRIRIPRINVDADVVEVGLETTVGDDGQLVTTWGVADFAAGFHRGSAYPGHPGNTVIAAHNNIRGRIFRHLLDLLPGDDIYLYAEGQEFHYIVSQVLLIEEKGMPEQIIAQNAKWIQPTSDERLTLVSCWPFIKPDHRVVAVAFPP